MLMTLGDNNGETNTILRAEFGVICKEAVGLFKEKIKVRKRGKSRDFFFFKFVLFASPFLWFAIFNIIVLFGLVFVFVFVFMFFHLLVIQLN